MLGGSGKGAALAEYLTVLADRTIALKPANVTFEEAGSVAVAGITALKALRDKGRIQPGHKVLINGASGGVGTFAVQIAKAFGAEVTGVCSARNVAMVREIGADDVVDYTQEDFTRHDKRYDLIVERGRGSLGSRVSPRAESGRYARDRRQYQQGPLARPAYGHDRRESVRPVCGRRELVTLFATRSEVCLA